MRTPEEHQAIKSHWKKISRNLDIFKILILVFINVLIGLVGYHLMGYCIVTKNVSTAYFFANLVGMSYCGSCIHVGITLGSIIHKRTTRKEPE